MKQKFIVKTWYGADTYVQAAKKQLENGYSTENCGYDFSRLTVKKNETALEYLKGWKKQAIEKGWQCIYRTYCREDARYEIVSTPDGYNEKEVVASGWMRDL